MDTKLKKSKLVISFISWYVGMVLFVVSISGILLEAFSYPDLTQRIKSVFDGDYQNTADFRYTMSDYMNTFLSMSVYGPVSAGTVYEGAYYESAEASMETVAETTVISDTAFASGTNTWGYDNTSIDSYYSVDTDIAENKKEAQAYNEKLQNDRNILYTIAHNGEVLYTNEDSLGLYDENFTMPEGYNFLMYFDGSKVTLIKDGVPADIYGDGYYQDDTDWYVPGYQNFPADEALTNSKICIVTARTPSVVIRKNYSGTGSNYYSNTFYQMQQDLIYARHYYRKLVITFLLAISLLAIGIVLRKFRKEANRKIALLTGKLWYEVKLLPFLAVLCICLLGAYLFLRCLYWYNPLWEFIYAVYHYNISGKLIFFSLSLLLCFCIIWLFINDARYNQKAWRKSLSAKAAAALKASDMKLPLAKRFVKNQAALLLTELILGICILLIIGIWGAYCGLEEEALVLFCTLGFFFVLVWTFQFLSARKYKQLGKELDILISQIETIYHGNLTTPVQIPGDSELLEAMTWLNAIRSGMDTALKEQMRSEHMKVELIANVSHDIKTPLTSIISYVELLKQEEALPEHVKEYISILENKSQRLKAMVQDVFEVSKAASGELPVNNKELNLAKLLNQTIADMAEQIAASTVIMKPEIPEDSVLIYADGDRLYRVFQNLIQNALKYSLDGSRVYITLHNDGRLAVASVKSTSKEELSSDIDFTERFTRGDKSRSDGGSGLGLSIAQSFTEACGGTFQIETVADLFIVTVSFPRVIA